MKSKKLTDAMIKRYEDYLYKEEKSCATREKYMRDVRNFVRSVKSAVITKDVVMQWKKQLLQSGYAVRSINSMLASVNSLLSFLGWVDCKVKNIRMQRQTYTTEEKVGIVICLSLMT